MGDTVHTDNGNDDRKRVIVYQFNDELAEFEELEFDEEEVKLYELLDPSFILLFLDPEHYKAWIWQGSEATTRMKFISAKLAGSVRDSHGVAMKLVTADEGNEPLAFKIMVGLEKEITYEDQDIGPAYKGTEEDIELLSLASRDKLTLILEKFSLPDGYKRSIVIRNNEVYKYHVVETEYMGKVVEEKQLIPLDEHEQVPDGPYLAEGYVPRLIFSFNKIVLLELLEKMTEEEIALQKKKQEEILKAMERERLGESNSESETETQT